MPVRNLPGRFPALARLIMAHRPVVGSYGRRFMKSCATWVMCRGGTLPWKPAGPGERNGSAPLRPSWWLGRVLINAQIGGPLSGANRKIFAHFELYRFCTDIAAPLAVRRGILITRTLLY